MWVAVAHGAHSYTFRGHTASHARLTPKLVVLARSIQAIVTLHVFVTIVGTIAVTVAHKVAIYAAARVTFEQIGGTRVVSDGACIRWLVFATATITIAITKPAVRYATVICASKLTRRTRHAIAKELILVS